MFNRIIAILVVIAIGVLVSPFLANHHSNALNAEKTKAPPFPSQASQHDTIQAIDYQTPSMLASKNTKTLTNILSTQSKKYKIKNHAKSKAWIVQVGSFKDKVGALRLANKLRAQGYHAFIYQKGAAFGEQVGVFIGPEVKRRVAEVLASKVSKETKLSTTVKSYKPLAA